MITTETFNYLIRFCLVGAMVYFVVVIVLAFIRDSKLVKERIKKANLISTRQARISSQSNKSFLLAREENPCSIKIFAELGFLYIYFDSSASPFIISKEEETDFIYTYYLVKLYRSISGEVQLKFKSRKKIPYSSYSITISNMTEEDFNYVRKNII